MRAAGDNRGTMFFNENNFQLKHTCYEKNLFCDHYYWLDTPLGCRSKLAREGGLARRRISKKLYFEKLAECLAEIDAYEKWAASIRRVS